MGWTELFKYARDLTTWLSWQYGIAVKIEQCRAQNSYYIWRSGEHRICYSPNDLRETAKYGHHEYARVQHCWSSKLKQIGFEGVHHLVLHEFAHVLDAEYGPHHSRTHTPLSRRSSGGRRILHGTDFQGWLTELVILVPFDEATPASEPA